MDVADTQNDRTRSLHVPSWAWYCLICFCRLLVLPSWASSNFLGALHSLLVLTSWQGIWRLLVLPSWVSASVPFLGAFFALCSLLGMPSWASFNYMGAFLATQEVNGGQRRQPKKIAQAFWHVFYTCCSLLGQPKEGTPAHSGFGMGPCQIGTALGCLTLKVTFDLNNDLWPWPLEGSTMLAGTGPFLFWPWP